ncbi:MAG: indole-3-glycerol phosphate synthase TrpC [Rhodospirillales bacterium]
MTDVLAEICDRKRAHVAEAKSAMPMIALEAKARAASPVRGFADALMAANAAGRYPLIAEIKKASPSKGLIRGDFDPPALARAYAGAGAACLSVLTDEPYFQGADDFLVLARESVSLPVLRKDFMVDPYQIVESRALGADCILLIMAAIGDQQAAELEAAAHEWGMDVLVEVHSAAEFERALELKSPLLGVNNRNLKTLSVDLAISDAILPNVPADRLAVAESGIATTADLERFWCKGARAFLVGESLMRQDDVAEATRALLGGGPNSAPAAAQLARG